MNLYQPTISGSLTVSGSVEIIGPFTISGGSITGTASFSENSGLLSNLDSGSFVGTGSFNTVSSSFSTVSSSFVTVSSSYSAASGSLSTRVTKIEGNYATTGSNVFTGAQTVCANITSTGTIIAQTLNVQQVTSSIVYSSGSNVFGCSTSDVQQFTGSVRITGSLNTIGNACVTSICSPTFIGGTMSGTTIYGSTIACSPIGCFTTSCASAFVGGTISGTTIYGSTAICGAVICGGATTLTGALSGTSATFSGNLSSGTNGSRARLDVLGSGTANTSGDVIGDALITGISLDPVSLATGNLFIQSNDAQAANKGGSIAFGGRFQGDTQGAGFAAIKGAKENSTSGNLNGYLAFYTRDSSAGVLERMRITSGGDININMPNSTNRYLSWYSANGLYQVAAISSITDPSYNDAGNLIFSTAKTSSAGFTEKMRITPNGNVGIGTSSPAANRKLTVAGGAQFTYGDNSGASFNIVPGTNGQDGADFNLSYYTGTGYGPLTFTLGGTERMRITSGGTVNITSGVSGPRFFSYCDNMCNLNGLGLDMAGCSYEFGLFFAYGTSDNGRISFGSYQQTCYRSKMIILGNGNIGVPGNATAIYNASDCRLKNNVEPLNYGLAQVMCINPVKFNWKCEFLGDECARNNFGFIAQQVQSVLPDLVEQFGGSEVILSDGTVVDIPLRINEKNLTPVLVKAIQEQQCQICTQASTIIQLKTCLGII